MLKPNRIKWVAVLHAQVIPGPNHGLGTNYPNRCNDFSQFLKANARIVPSFHILASHKSNPSSITLSIIDSYCTVPWVMWEVITVVEGIP
jgi:hypothetical protein